VGCLVVKGFRRTSCLSESLKAQGVKDICPGPYQEGPWTSDSWRGGRRKGMVPSIVTMPFKLGDGSVCVVDKIKA